MLSTKQVMDIIVWFRRRFEAGPTEKLGYFNEWLRRFDRGKMEFLAHMDDQSKRIWAEVQAGEPQ